MKCTLTLLVLVIELILKYIDETKQRRTDNKINKQMKVMIGTLIEK